MKQKSLKLKPLAPMLTASGQGTIVLTSIEQTPLLGRHAVGVPNVSNRGSTR